MALSAALTFSTLAATLCLLAASPLAEAKLDGDEEIRCAKDGWLTFLFAHGLDEEPEAWHTFAHKVVTTNPKYGVWRTQVKKKGHIHERGHELAAFMAKAQKKCGTPDKSVVAVGHSMGGLDLRYIVGKAKHADQRKLLKAVYTIATPHLGDPDACGPPGGGIHDLCGHPKDPDKPSPMHHFNKKYPYSDFKKYDIAFKAFWYECKDKEPGEDGVVLIESQKWKDSGAPHEDRGKGYHRTKEWDDLKYCETHHHCVPELCQEDEMERIIDLQIHLLNKVKSE